MVLNLNLAGWGFGECVRGELDRKKPHAALYFAHVQDFGEVPFMISLEGESSEVFVQEILEGLPRAPWYFERLVSRKSTGANPG